MAMILIPARLASSGPNIATGSVIEIMMASGLVATTELSTWVWSETAKLDEPWYAKLTPELLASVAAPQATVL